MKTPGELGFLVAGRMGFVKSEAILDVFSQWRIVGDQEQSLSGCCHRLVKLPRLGKGRHQCAKNLRGFTSGKPLGLSRQFNRLGSVPHSRVRTGRQQPGRAVQ